jgi:hypothetical protein
VGADRDDRDGDRDTDGRERDPQPHRGLGVAPAGGQPALGEDHRQSSEADGVGDLGVLELDADAGLSQGDAHHQVDQQARQAGAAREPDREDRGEGDGRAHQQEHVELVEVEAHVTSGAWGGGF